VGAGLLAPERAVAVLNIAGTSPAYRGLFQSAEQAHPFDKALLDALEAEFPATAKLPAMAEAMVEIEHIHGRLQAIERAGWQTPTEQPALVPDHEALLLREQFTELLRTKELAAKPAQFQAHMQEAEALAKNLEAALIAGAGNEVASRLLRSIGTNCKTCHQTFRDVPLREQTTKPLQESNHEN
jgi:hypothetical protein